MTMDELFELVKSFEGSHLANEIKIESLEHQVSFEREVLLNQLKLYANFIEPNNLEEMFTIYMARIRRRKSRKV